MKSDDWVILAAVGAGVVIMLGAFAMVILSARGGLG